MTPEWNGYDDEEIFIDSFDEDDEDLEDEDDLDPREYDPDYDPDYEGELHRRVR
jgi:hypothetical protein